MDNDTPISETPTNGSASAEPQAGAIALDETDIHAGGSLTNADVAALSRERLQTLLAILPPAVAAILITNRPPMPPHVEYEAHKRLVAALAKARAKIPSVPMDKTVDYVSKRTGEHVHYSFASLDSISKTVTQPLSEHGLVLECVFNGDVIVVLLSHEDGGIHLSWLPLPDEGDIKDLATQITMRRRYLTTQLIAIVADEDTGERDIAEPKKGAGQRRTPPDRQRRTAAPVGGRGRPPAGDQHGTPGGEQLANRTNALLAKLPDDVAGRLREQHKDPNELLRRTTEELNRRNAAKSRGEAPAANGDAPESAQNPPGDDTPAGTATGSEEAEPPADPAIEKHINDGMRALKLGAEEQATLRNQFRGNPRGLLEHIKALYNAERSQDGS
ncbi:MAG: ERF family protein [Acidobacteria bacterium]|nr:ERF family protein [Acidobacteriota bacterium]